MVDLERLKDLGHQLLVALGEDPAREGLQGTPERWARAWAEFIDHEETNADTTFVSTSVDQMVVVTGMRVWSYCEHHLLPFWADVSVGYIPKDRVIGLSKFARVAHRQAHKLQLQERLVSEIAAAIRVLSKQEDVAVLASGVHLCMVMRGVQTPATMTTSVTHGLFRSDPRARAEFLRLVGSA